jgi:hypothetical protein
LAIQLVMVLMVIALVSWPQFRPVRTPSVWQSGPNVSGEAQGEELSRADEDSRGEAIIGFGRAIRRTSEPLAAPLTVPAVAGHLAREYKTPVAVAALGGKVNALVGVAQTSWGTPFRYARIVARNIDAGTIEARATANDVGRFSFLDLDPGSYVIELLGPAGSVVVASEVVPLGLGDVRQTTLHTIAAAPNIAASFGNRLTGTLDETTTIAAVNGVTRTASHLTPQESPNSPTSGGW